MSDVVFDYTSAILYFIFNCFAGVVISGEAEQVYFAE